MLFNILNCFAWKSICCTIAPVEPESKIQAVPARAMKVGEDEPQSKEIVDNEVEDQLGNQRDHRSHL